MGCNACFRPSLQININIVCNKRRDINFPFCSLIDKMKVIPNKTENKISILDLENSKCIEFFMHDKRTHARHGVTLCIYWFFFLKHLTFRIIVFMNDLRNHHILTWT